MSDDDTIIIKHPGGGGVQKTVTKASVEAAAASIEHTYPIDYVKFMQVLNNNDNWPN